MIYVDSELRINKRKSILYTDCLVFLGIRNNLGLLTIMFASVASKKKNKTRDLGPGRSYKNVFELVHSPIDLRIYLGKLSF